MRWVRNIALGLVALYTLGFAGVAVFQRQLLYHPHKDIVAPTLPGVERIEIKTPDGETLTAWWRAPQPHGIVFLFFDGNGGAPELWNARWREIAQANAGFLAVYYRGYSGSTGHPTERGLITDARAGYEWLRDHEVEPRRIVIHGFSLGSGVAVQLGAEKPARALVLEAPFTAAVDVAARSFPVYPVHLIMKDQFTSHDFVGRVKMPIFIAHGDQDEVIPFHMGERMHALANEPKEFARVRGGTHLSLVRDGVYNRIWAFLALHPATE